MRNLHAEAASRCCVLNLLRVRDDDDEGGGSGSMIVVVMVLEAGAEPRCAPLSNPDGEPLEAWLRQRTATSSI